MDRDHILLPPGPLTTTLRTKLAMLKDWGSWDTDFIAVTASVLAHEVEAYLQAGVDGVLPKPIEASALAAALSECLAEPG